MSEDHTMDKKPRSTQCVNKGNGSESKKSQDVATSKQFPKQSRRREPANSTKNEASGRSKPLPQKFKSFDKRPKPRGGIASGKENTKINLYEGDEPELGSLYSPGSKKQNLNHLLNFQYASPPRHYEGRISSGSGYNNYLMQGQKHKYNKEQFLQANCQFVVRAGEDYAMHLGDPDTLVKWEFIQQIRGFGNEEIKCPICLDLPRAPQLTRCGHCFCWPCILHYLALSDKTWRKCPICYEAVHLTDLKSFRSVIKHSHSVNEEVTFQLMKRERGSIVISPLAQWEMHVPDKLMHVTETRLDTSYAKLLSATLDDILDMLKVEEEDLTLLLEELRQEQCPTLCFTERALELLQNRRSHVLTTMGKRHDSIKTTSPHTDTIQNENQQDSIETKPLPAELPFSGGNLHETVSASKSETMLPSSGGNLYETVSAKPEPSEQNMDTLQNNQSEEDQDAAAVSEPEQSISSVSGEDTQPSRFFYFYQATDGQQLFLHAVNVRMLEMTYGSLALCPATVTGRIVEKEAGSMTEALRQRLRYLQHLPVTCQFEVAEIDLKPPLISDDTMERYRDQLASRERRRVKRARDDKRRAARIAEVEYVQLRGGVGGNQTRRRGNLHIDSHYQFPECGVGGIPGLASSADYSTESSRASSPRRPDSPLTTALTALSLDQHQQDQLLHTQSAASSSFAQRLRAAGSSLSAGDNSVFWPSVGETSNIDTRRRTVSEDSSVNTTASLAPTPAPPAQGEAQSSQQRGSNAQGGQNKKKKRKQQTLLFATGGMKVNNI